jgi:hypothetical protein
MKFRLNIIATIFNEPIEKGKEQEVIQRAKHVIETYGLKERKNSSNEKLIFRPSIFQHFAFQPFARTSITTVEVIEKDDYSVLSYRIFHPTTLLFPIIILIFAVVNDQSNMYFISAITLFMEMGIIFFMQLTIFKQILKSLDKTTNTEILDN